jgi:glycosyltransferase involved in cell wall biosynthesis
MNINDNAYSFIIPCYHETSSAIENTVEILVKTMESIPGITYEIILVNDGCPPEDVPVFSYDTVSWIHHGKNRGYGASLMSGIMRSQYDWIGIIDADGTYPVNHFRRFCEFTKEYDMIVGKRTLSDIPPIKRFPKYLLQAAASFIACETIPDLNSGMRLFKKEIVLKYMKMFPKRFSFTTTLTMICSTNFYKVRLVDIPYYKRIGKSGIRPIKDTTHFFSLVFRLALYFKPLRVFIPLSGIVLLGAIARGVRDVLLDNHFGGLTLVLFFMAFQIFFFGLIAEIINKK